jgi:hypothetical protein
MHAVLRAMFVASALALTGCLAPRAAPIASDLRVDPAAFDAEPRRVTAADAEADLDHALTLFADAYAAPEGTSAVPPAERIDETRASLRAHETWAPRALATLLRDLFRADDGHLAFGYGGRSPLRLEALAAPPAPVERSAERAPIELIEGDVPVLVVRTFESASAPRLAALPRLASRLRRAPAFVVDLRGNHGGNYTFAEALLLALADGPIRALDTREVQSVAALVGRANAARRRLARGDVGPEAREVFNAQIDRLEGLARELASRGEGRIEVVRRGEILQGRAGAPLFGRGVLLVDRGCASACEMLVALARQVPRLVVAGERTHGSMAVGEVASFRLPRSGIVITLGTRATVDPLGDFDERRGFSPDVPLDGPDVLASARRFAAEGGASAWALARARAPSLVPRRAAEMGAAASLGPVRQESR